MNASLSERMALLRARRIETAPMTFRKLLADSMAGKCSPRQAIKAQCSECAGFVRDDITTCTAYACPLWAYRPHQKGEK